MKSKKSAVAPVPSPVVSVPAPTGRRGRPSSGVDRKTQIREAARRRRARLVDKVKNLAVEVPSPAFFFLQSEAERQGLSFKALVEQIMFTGIQKYIVSGRSHLGASNESVADAILKDWKKNPTL